MKKLTVNEYLKSVPKRWRKQYFEIKGGNWFRGSDKSIYEKLRKCGPNKENIDKIIGNDSWTSLTCSECELSVNKLIVFEEYRSIIALCQNCLSSALGLIQK